MGRRARLKRERRRRRELRAFKDDPAPISAPRGEPLRILREIHRDIQNICHESPRQCWEYMLEMLAQCTNWNTETDIARHVAEKMYAGGNLGHWLEFVQCWTDEVDQAKRNRTEFSEPIGQLLEEIEGINNNLSQFLTPMTVVRAMNEISLTDNYTLPYPDGRPSRTGLDPTCGTGRFILDALVHDDGVQMHGVEIDLWLLRAAMLNARLLSKYTALVLTEPTMEAFGSRSKNRFPSTSPTRGDDDDQRFVMMGGRAVFMHADSLVVDLFYAPNWRYPLYEWTPPPWQSNLKINGFDGAMDDYERLGRPSRNRINAPADEVRFDYSMTDKPGPAP